MKLENKVFDKTKLTCSAGVACNKTLAKIWSDMNKPDGHYILEHEIQRIEDFVKDLNIRKIPGVGKVFEGELKEIGVVKCGDVIDKITDIYTIFSERTTIFLMHWALGIARNKHEKDENYVQK